MRLRTLDDADFDGKKVLLRAGFDVPIEKGRVVDTTRIEAILPTITELREKAAVIIIAHQGRPKGERVPEMSQKPVAEALSELLGMEVKFCDQCVGPEAEAAAEALQPGEVLLLENLRYEKGEKKNDPEFAKQLAALADIYVNDAFTNCHREHASMVGVPQHLPSFAGRQVEKEVKNLSVVLEDPRRPVTLIVSGVKMETKVPVIENFLQHGDDVLVGGCIANTFIAAKGFNVAKSRYEEEQIKKAQEIMLESEKVEMATVHVPRDAVVATEMTEEAEKVDLPVENISVDMAIYDVGKVTIKRYIEIIEKSGTIVWNGPLGVHELNRFSHATKRIAEAVAKATKRGSVTIVGGGDTLDFHERYDYPLDAYTFVSTAGGAMLEFISGKELPALKALQSGK